MAKETEIVVIFKIGNFEGLKEASAVEEQEQLELFIPGKGRTRVRKTVDEDGTVFEACVKTAKKQDGSAVSCLEVEEKVSSSYMEGFRHLADSLQIKTRYEFDGTQAIIESNDKSVTLPPLKYEVDVFKRPDGSISDWAKIDIELDDLLETLKSVKEFDGKDINFTIKVTHLPFKPQNAFIVGDCTEEQQKAMNELWEKEWTQDPFGGPRKPISSSVSALKPPSQQPEVTTTPEADNERQNNKQSV